MKQKATAGRGELGDYWDDKEKGLLILAMEGINYKLSEETSCQI